jgi:hypothetical protein
MALLGKKNRSTYHKDETLKDLEKLEAQAKGLHSRFENTWYLNMSYYVGEQWIFWNRGRLDRPVLPPWRVTFTDNRITGIINTELARMTRQRPAWQVVPTSADDQDIQASQTGEKILDYLWRHLHMEHRLYEVLLWSRVCGAGFWKIYWDSAKGQSVNIVTDQEGKPVMDTRTSMPMRPEHFGEEGLPEGLQEKLIATGDVTIETYSPFELLPDPIPRNFEDCEWTFQLAVKSPEWVKRHYGQEVEPDTDVAPGPVESRLFPSFQLGGTSGYKGVKLHEYWAKRSSQHPEGRHVVFARGKILYEGPNEYGCLPYVMFKGIWVPGRLWPSSIVEFLRSPQTELNKIKSQLIENLQRFGNPSLLCSKQAGIAIEGVPGERVDYDDTTPNAIPSYLMPPSIPAWVEKQIERCEQSIQEISGQHEVSNAQVPPGVKAASAINLLQEADDTRLGPTIRQMEDTMGEAGTMLLKLVAENWTDERMVMIAGEDHAWDAMSFRGAALKGNTRAEVQAGSSFPHSKAARQAAMQDILQLFLQYEGVPIDPRQLRKFLKLYEAGGLEALFADLTVSESQINREHQKLAQGIPIGINPFDEHQAHILGHTEWQRTASYENLPSQVGINTERHVQEHREQLIAAQAPLMEQPLQPGGQNGNQNGQVQQAVGQGAGGPQG